MDPGKALGHQNDVYVLRLGEDDPLLLVDGIHGLKVVAPDGGLLEIQLLRGLLHLPLHLSLDAPIPALQEIADLFDQRPVVLPADISLADAPATVDMEVEARRESRPEGIGGAALETVKIV